MSWLLHSKRFRVNLKKWLCMYVGVILTFTTVITYSRYVSTFTASSSARVAKFKVDIYCDKGANGRCDNNTYSRYQTITYRFTLDRDIEVTTGLELKILVDKRFVLESVEDTTRGEIFYDKVNKLGDVSSDDDKYNLFTIKGPVMVSGKDTPIYEVKVSYDNTSVDARNLDESFTDDVVRVGFVATQKN